MQHRVPIYSKADRTNDTMTIHTSRSLRSPIRKHRNLEDDQKNQKRSRTLPLLCYSPNDEILALRGGALPPKGSRRAKSKRVQPPRAAKGGKTNQKSGRSQDQSSAPKVVDSTTGPSLAGTVGATQSVNRTHAGGDAKDPRPPVVPAAATSPNTKRKEPPTPLPGIPVNNPAPESSIPFQPLLSARKTHTSNNRDVSGSTWLKTGRTTQAASNERVPVVAIDPGNRENHDDEIQQPQTPPHLFEEDDLYNSTPPSSPTLNRNLFHAAAQAKRNDDGGGDTSPSFSGRPFTEDDEILRHWARLGRIVAHFVDTVLVDRLPEEAITNASFPFKALEPLSSLAADMCRSPRYAKYLFQIGIWNILDRIFFTTLSTAWACEEFGVSPHTQTYGQAETLGRLTCEYQVHDLRTAVALSLKKRSLTWTHFVQGTLGYKTILGDPAMYTADFSAGASKPSTSSTITSSATTTTSAKSRRSATRSCSPSWAASTQNTTKAARRPGTSLLTAPILSSRRRGTSPSK